MGASRRGERQPGKSDAIDALALALAVAVARAVVNDGAVFYVPRLRVPASRRRRSRSSNQTSLIVTSNKPFGQFVDEVAREARQRLHRRSASSKTTRRC